VSGYPGGVGPYRLAVGAEIVEAPTRDGPVRLEVAPQHTLLEVGALHLSVTERFVTVANSDKRRKPHSMALDEGHLLVARGFPTEEIGVWYEHHDGLATRVFGVRPVELLDAEALEAWRALELLATRLRAALAPHAAGALRTTELGAGADRVLLTERDGRLLLYVRRLFRGQPRLSLEVRTDGTVILPRGRRRPPQRVRCVSRFSVTVLGDWIRFGDSTGADLASLAVPWIEPEERAELARRLGNHLHQDSAAAVG
jgi:hypothetical protein